MKKLIILTILSFLLSSNQSEAQHRQQKIEGGSIIVGSIAGGAFILMGALQKPDEKWIQDPNGTFINKNQIGYWRNETFFEDRNRVAAVLSGVFIIGMSIKITF